jgi:hypothetical protein
MKTKITLLLVAMAVFASVGFAVGESGTDHLSDAPDAPVSLCPADWHHGACFDTSEYDYCMICFDCCGFLCSDPYWVC